MSGSGPGVQHCSCGAVTAYTQEAVVLVAMVDQVQNVSQPYAEPILRLMQANPLNHVLRA